MHPAYAASDADSLRQLTSDIALVQLAEPISAAIASPFATAAPPGPGSRVSVVSYAHDRADAPAWQRACQLMGRGQGAMMMSCDTDFGSSGAPVFDMSAGRPRIVSLISRGVREDGQALVYGMEIAEPLAETKAALRAGRGVWPREGFSARRVTMGGAASGGGSALGGGGALNHGSGAHFVRP
jgi:protease YdgD